MGAYTGTFVKRVILVDALRCGDARRPNFAVVFDLDSRV